MSDGKGEEQPETDPPRPDPIQPGPRHTVRNESVPLRDYVEMRIAFVDDKNVMRVEALGKELAVSIRASELAVAKAEASVDQRLEGMNEFRAQLTHQAATFATKDDLLNQRVVLQTDIASTRAALDAKQAAQGEALETKIDAIWKVVFSLAGALAAIQATLAFLT